MYFNVVSVCNDVPGIYKVIYTDGTDTECIFYKKLSDSVYCYNTFTNSNLTDMPPEFTELYNSACKYHNNQ